MSLKTIFDSIDASKASNEASDRIALTDGTITTGFGPVEETGIYFIPEGDKRLNDKLNYNLSYIMENRQKIKNFKIVNTHTPLNDNDFIFVDTSDRIAQIDDISSITVNQDYTYSVTLNSSTVTYISGIKQVDILNTFTAVNETLYRVTLDGDNADYTSEGNAETRELNSFTQVDDDVYEISIAGIDLSYTSVAGDDITNIINDLTSKINGSAAPVNATASSTDITIVGDVSGDAFALSITSGQMTASLITAATSATIDQIIAGLKDAIDLLGNPVSVVNASTSITITANVRGTAFTLTEASDNFNASNSVPNYIDTKSDIITRIKTKVNALNEPLTLTSDDDTITFTADVPGVAFTLTTDSNLNILNVIPNFDGKCDLTFPSDPENFSMISIMDYTNTFGTTSPILKSVNKIMGSTLDYDLIIANKATIFIAINKDWRIL